MHRFVFFFAREGTTSTKVSVFPFFFFFFFFLCAGFGPRKSNGSIADGLDCYPGNFSASVVGAVIHRHPGVHQLYRAEYIVSRRFGD